MPSDTTGEEGSTPPQPKSKQERIRDNQRRSRARRQEYLADLERRLAEAQLTCREADIQRASFLELQIENARLRELLTLAGVNDQFVTSYVSQALAQSGQFPQSNDPALRQLKPKINIPEIPRVLPTTLASPIATTSAAVTAPIQAPRRSSMALMPTSSTLPSIGASTTTNTTAATPYLSTSFPVQPTQPHSQGQTPVQNNTRPSNYTWQFQPPPATLSRHDHEHRCMVFNIPATAPVRVADNNSIPCSVAKQMLEQYHLSDPEMNLIKAKLARGLCVPADPATGCAVDNQVFFKILEELNLRFT